MKPNWKTFNNKRSCVCVCVCVCGRSDEGGDGNKNRVDCGNQGMMLSKRRESPGIGRLFINQRDHSSVHIYCSLSLFLFLFFFFFSPSWGFCFLLWILRPHACSPAPIKDKNWVLVQSGVGTTRHPPKGPQRADTNATSVRGIVLQAL